MKLDLLFHFLNKFLYFENNLIFIIGTFTLSVVQLHPVITPT